MIELFSESPFVFVAVVFAFCLIIGSFLNVVIYRLPIMMERDWREQARQLLEEPAEDLPEGPFNLVVPRSRCPSCGAQSALSSPLCCTPCQPKRIAGVVVAGLTTATGSVAIA